MVRHGLLVAVLGIGLGALAVWGLAALPTSFLPRLRQGREILDAAVEAARLRFRPILMTSFVLILGVLPLVFATDACANARRSIGITVASGMLASTCIAVLFVPAFFVVLQRFSERTARRQIPHADPNRAGAAETD
jgi:HAE1 family hydrophobic/amphiphilic exporter-1